MVGIVGYGAYIPRYRIKVEEIAKVWGSDASSYKKDLMLEEKSVPSPDQDTVTIAVEAVKNALQRADIDPGKIGAVYAIGIIELDSEVKVLAQIVDCNFGDLAIGFSQYFLPFFISHANNTFSVFPER